jgi:hypothetical protein
MRRFVFVLLLVLVVAGCPGRPPVEPPPEDLGIVAGRVFKGPVKEAAVTVYRLDGLKRGAVVGSAATDAEGAFRIPVGTSTGPFFVVAAGGSYIDEATGVTVQAGTAELTALVPVFDIETKLEQLRITPVSHLAATLALFWAEAEARPLVDTDAEAWTRLNQHFGGLDWRIVTPRDVTTATGATLADDATKAGLLLGALSMQTRLVSEAAGLTPGGRVNPSTLVSALADDITADGFFDGIGTRGQLVLPLGGQVRPMPPTATPVDGQTARTALGQALARFIATDRNSTAVTVADVASLVQAISANADARLFRGAAVEADIDAPVLTWVRPQANAGVRGMVTVEVAAADNREVRTLAFTAPAALAGAIAVIAPDKTSGRLVGTLDVSALMDGPLEVSVRAVDAAGNEATSKRTLIVSQRGPVITVATPSAMATVRGVVTIAASAAPQSAGAAITKLELRAPTAGVSPDTEASAALLSVQWSTAAVPEGEVTLSFHAEDSQGGVADFEVPVAVDNLPFGRVEAFVSAGAPLAGATVKLLAIDSATGLPVTGRPGGAVLGEGVTDAMGLASFTLTQENYLGPVQLEATGANLAVPDVSDALPALDGGAAASVSMPSTFALSSYIASYRAGDVLTAHATLYTTIADSAARAYATGRVAGVSAVPLQMALPVVDALFVGHVSRPRTWQLRAVRPAPIIATGQQTLRDTVYAAFPDVALHQLARDISVAGQTTPGTAVTAFTLAEQLVRDVGDGVFDGRAGAQQLSVPGMPPQVLDANASRFRLASALDRWVRGPRNLTSLTRPDIQADGVFDNLCTSAPPANPLYPAGVAPIPFDSTAPSVSFVVTFSNGTLTDSPPLAVGPNQVVAGTVKVTATAADDSGMRSLVIRQGGTQLTELVGNSPERWAGTHTPTASGSVSYVATACDTLNNCSTATVTVLADSDAPAITVAQPSGQRVRLAVPVDASATDAAGVASLAVTAGLAGFTDTDASAARVQGSWTLPVMQPDGTVTATMRACDVVGNCRTATATAVVDRTPPTTTLVVTWQRPGLLSLQPQPTPPVGPTRLVGGNVFFEATAVDAAGLASTAVVAGMLPVTAGSGNTPARFAGSVVTAADGALAIVATACDAIGNCGDTTSAVVVDNTPPAITVVSPATTTGYFSGAVPLEAIATDSSGLFGGRLTNSFLGHVDQDGSPARIFGTMTPEPSVMDGPFSTSVNFVDNLFNSATATLGFIVDRTAPTITTVTAPPQHTQASTVSLTVTASDGAGAGVTGVFVKVGAGASVAGSRSGSTWSFPAISLGTSGAATITVWGVDAATAPNSGEGRTSPASLSYTVIRDTLPPVVVLSPAASFQDEDQLGLQVDGSGIPLTPPSYTFPTNPPARTINVTPLPTPIRRAVTRLNDATNRPILQVSTTVQAGSEAPITSATWATTRPCALGGSCVPALGGFLTASGRSGPPGTFFWDLPLSLPESGTYDITLSLTDAAGNVGTLSQRLTWELVGPPVVLRRDTAWDNFTDPQSVRAASLSSRTYQRLFGAAPQPVAGRARLARWLVYNPAAEPVAVGLNVAFGANRTTTENWVDVIGSLYRGFDEQYMDGFNTYRTRELFFVTNQPPDSCSNSSGTYFNFVYTAPCSPMFASNGTLRRVRHRRGDPNAWECYGDSSAAFDPLNGRSNTFSITAGDISGLYFDSPAPLGSGNEVTLSPEARFTTAINGRGGVVPAAAGGQPGVIAVYLTLPSNPGRPADVGPTPSTAPLPNLAGNDYKFYWADLFEIPDVVQPYGTFFWASGYQGCNTTPFRQVMDLAAFYNYRRLASATTTVGAQWSVVTGGALVPRSTAFPPANWQQSTVSNRVVTPFDSFTATIPH